MTLFTELKRRNVFRVAAAYLVGAWLLIEVADTVFPRLGLPDWTVTLVIALALLGLPLALFLSWAYELTPEGVKRSEEVDPHASVTPGTGRRIDRMILIGALAVIAIMAVERVWFAERGSESTSGSESPAVVDSAAQAKDSDPLSSRGSMRSIAVLAFDDLSAEGDQEYFADGIAEEILNLLAKLPELKVAGRTSAFQFKGRNEDLRKIGEALGVDTILEGSVRKAGERVRVTAQLVGAADGFHLWSETYDRELTDIFAIQDDIARAIAGALRVELFGAVAEREYPTDNLEAYQLYLQGHHLVLQRGVDNLKTAIERLERAVSLDPDFAGAWAELGVALALLPSYGVGHDQEVYFQRATAATQRALVLAPELAMALAAQGFVAFNSGRFGEGLAFYPRALKLDPDNETIWLWYGVHLTSLGHIEAALEKISRAYALSPSTGINAGWLGLLYSVQGDDARARRFIDEGIALGWAYSYTHLAFNLSRAGDVAGAQQAMRGFLRSVGEPEHGLDAVIASVADPAFLAQAEAELDAHLQQKRHFSTYYGAALMHRGDVLAEYFESVSNNRIAEWGFLLLPGARPILNDPALQAYMQRIGLVDYWRENGWPEYCRPLAGDDFECGLEAGS